MTAIELVPGNSLATATPEGGRQLAVKMARLIIKLTQPDADARGVDLDRRRCDFADRRDRHTALLADVRQECRPGRDRRSNGTDRGYLSEPAKSDGPRPSGGSHYRVINLWPLIGPEVDDAEEFDSGGNTSGDLGCVLLDGVREATFHRLRGDEDLLNEPVAGLL